MFLLGNAMQLQTHYQLACLQSPSVRQGRSVPVQSSSAEASKRTAQPAESAVRHRVGFSSNAATRPLPNSHHGGDTQGTALPSREYSLPTGAHGIGSANTQCR